MNKKQKIEFYAAASMLTVLMISATIIGWIGQNIGNIVMEGLGRTIVTIVPLGTMVYADLKH